MYVFFLLNKLTMVFEHFISIGQTGWHIWCYQNTCDLNYLFSCRTFLLVHSRPGKRKWINCERLLSLLSTIQFFLVNNCCVWQRNLCLDWIQLFSQANVRFERLVNQALIHMFLFKVFTFKLCNTIFPQNMSSYKQNTPVICPNQNFLIVL